MLNAAIYARYSSDKQSEHSIEDQIRLCRERAEREGWSIAENLYTDYAISGASTHTRPGLQSMLDDARRGKFDIVLVEALDRLSRDQADIALIYRDLTFRQISMHTLSEGEINEMHIGLKGTMNSMFLKDLAQKVRRGIRGRVENGRSGGGNAYGYDIVKEFGADGEPIRGKRTINDEQAAIVQRIFNEYISGKSPLQIAHDLNKEGVEGPNGKHWGPSTIYGNRRRGTGILNNRLYVGELIWNKLRYIKNPDTGKRQSFMNPESEWIIKDVPLLRIVSDEVWDMVAASQKKLDSKGSLQAKQRPSYLLSGLIKCGCCGGGYAVVNKTHIGCSTARNKGTCNNKLRMKRLDLENFVVKSLQKHLMQAELVEEFCKTYVAHTNEIRLTQSRQIALYNKELAKLNRQEDRIMDHLYEGRFAKDRLQADYEKMEKRRNEVKALLSQTEEPPVLFHPAMGDRYQKEIIHLLEALNNKETNTPAITLLRRLIDKIELTPNESNDALTVDLHGDLAGILSLATNDKTPPEGDVSVSELTMVAGVGFEPTAFRL